MNDPMDSIPQIPGAENFAQAILTLNAMLEPIIEATNGLKSSLESNGYTQDVSSQMAGEYYRTVMAMLRVKAFGANG